MALTLRAEIFEDVFILCCDGRIVFGDECSVFARDSEACY